MLIMFIRTLIILCLLVYQAFFWFPKIVWTYWDHPLIQSGHLINAFHKNHLKFTKGWQLRHLDKNNIWRWLDKVPNLKQKFQSEAWKNEGFAKKSDIIRMALVNYYGGMYFDMTIILTQNVDWILQFQNKGYYFGPHKQPDVFIHYAIHSNGQKYFDKKSESFVPIIPNFQSFFIAGKPNSKFLTQWLNLALSLKQQSFKIYGKNVKKSLIIDKAISQNTPISFFKNQHFYFQIIVCGGYLLNTRQKQLQKQFRRTSNTTQPLAIKYYNLWLMDISNTGYKFISAKCSILQYITRYDINQLKKKQIYSQYFVKLWRQPFQKMRKSYQQQKDYCNGSQIHNNSIICQFLINYYHKDIKDIIGEPVQQQHVFFCYKKIIVCLMIIVFILINIAYIRQKSKKLSNNTSQVISTVQNTIVEFNQ